MRMRIRENKTKSATMLAIVLLLSLVTVMMLPVTAQTSLPAGTYATNWRDSASQLLPSGVTPDVPVKTKAYLNVRPTTVGLGQTFLVNLWTTPALHAARYFKDYKVTIQKPSGDTQVITIDSYRADSTAWFEYIADEEGTWKLKFDFEGGYFPAGNYSTAFGAVMYGQAQNFSFPQSCYYTPDSTGWQELVVQSEQVLSWTPAALPTDYWTRPASLENREWWWISGHFPWYGPGGGAEWPANTNIHWANGNRYRFTPWVQAPNTAHIAWKIQGAIGGLVGPLEGDQKVEAWSSGGGNPTIIYQGRAYQSYSKPGSGASAQTYWKCYDIRTGELFWERPVVTGESVPSALLYYEGYPEVPGGEPRFSKNVYLIAITGGRLLGYSPWTGAVTLNFSISPLTTGTYYRNGYWLTVQSLGGGNYRLINWTIEAIPGAFMVSSTTWQPKIVGNITWPWSSLGTTWDLEAGIAVTTNPLTPPAVGAWYGTNVRAADMVTGVQLWNKNYTETLYSSAATVADHGKVAFPTMNGYILGLRLRDGSVAWKSDNLDYPWDWGGFGNYGVASAYGLFFRFAYSGVYAFDWNTGKIAWKYESPNNPYETPYVNAEGEPANPFNGAGWIADGKIYVYNTEHTPTQPITRGWRLHCVNITTGEGIWNITGSMSPGAVADGYLTASNSYDGYMYVFGKGKSSTTIEAPLTAVTLGQKVVLKGTVLDQSPGQPGTPCVAKESMTQWMEYLHMQHTVPADVKGVSVSIDIVDPNSNFFHIADVTTDGYSGTFGYEWEPDVPGLYTVTATFMGDDSYGSSFATTYVSVADAPAATPTPDIQPAPDYTPLLYGILVVGIIAILLLLVMMFRKRQ